jgi:chromosome segregation ATPase
MEEEQKILDGLRVEIANAKNELGGIYDTKNVLDREAEQLQRDIVKLQEENEKKQHEGAKISTEIAQNQLLRNKIAKEVETLTSEKETLERLNKGIMDEQEDMIENAEEERIAIKKKYDQEIVEKTSEIDRVNMQIEGAMNEYKDIEDKKSIKIKEIISTQELLERIGKEIDKENFSLEEIKRDEIKTQEQLAETAQKIGYLSEQKASLSGELSSIQETIKEKRGELKVAEKELLSAKELVKTTLDSVADINKRAFSVTKREKDLQQKQQYVEEMYQEAGVPYTPYSE